MPRTGPMRANLHNVQPHSFKVMSFYSMRVRTPQAKSLLTRRPTPRRQSSRPALTVAKASYICVDCG